MTSKPLKYYDMIVKQPVEANCVAPNPWKSRFALNATHTPYKTVWITQPEISTVRKDLGMEAGRKFADGSDFYTVPMLVDPNTNKKLGDSFDIAVYANKQPQNKLDLFPKHSFKYSYEPGAVILVPLSDYQKDEYIEYREFNNKVDAMFSMHVLLWAHGMPFHPDSEEETKKLMCTRSNLGSWDDLNVQGEQRQQMMDSFKAALGDLKQQFKGPYCLGEQVCYADFIVGGWVRMISVAATPAAWAEVSQWHDGFIGKLYESLKPFMAVH